jgi:flagellar motor switch protein FliG
VGLTGKQKAALLLMSLDAVSAAELLKGVNHDIVQELAVELAYMDASGLIGSQQTMEVANQFCSMLHVSKGFQIKNFLDTMLKTAVGQEKAKQIQTQIQDLLQKRDPFMSIRSADSKVLASVLETEHPQATAIVLSELTSKKSSEVLGMLGEAVRLGAISRMTDSMMAPAETKRRIAEMVCSKLQNLTSQQGGAVQVDSDGPLRKVAVMLRNLSKEIRDGLIEALKEKDEEVSQKVSNLMVIWEDIPLVADRSLQNILREIDSQKLALALMKADEVIVKKIKSNISERMSATIDEETSLMTSPKKESIEQAKEEIVNLLRETNIKGELNFIEE